MSNESRLLGKQIILGDGIAQSSDMTGPAIFFEGGKIVMTAPVKINDADAITAWSTVYSLDFGSIAVTGTSAAALGADAVMSGVAVGDWVQATPIVSYPDRLFFQAACYSAGNVHITARQNGSGAFNPSNVTFRIIAIKVT